MDITLKKPFTNYKALVINFNNSGFVNGFVYPKQLLQSMINNANLQLGSAIATGTPAISYNVNYIVTSTTKITCGEMHTANCHIISIYGIK